MELFVLPGLYINISEQKEIIQNVLERKDSMAVLSMGFRKSMCYVLPPPPSYFGQGKIIYANHLP
jgi:superfamily II DNA helicase RecQ